MEEEIVCTSLLNVADSVLQQPQQDSWTSIDHQYIAGEKQANVWAEAEAQINRSSPKEGRDTPEETEQWEQIIWPVRPISCTSPQLSFATVQWDMPDPTADTSLPMTNSRVTCVDTASPLLQQFQDIQELFEQEVKEEEDEIDSQLVNSDLQGTGSNSEPCDAADVQEPTAQEKEDSAHELLDSTNEIPRTDSEVEEEDSATSDPVETADFTDILDGTGGSEDDADSFVDLKLEAEQEEASIPLTGQGESEEEPPSAEVVETEENQEGGGLEEETGVTDLCGRDEREEAQSVSYLSDVGVLAEALETDDTGPLIEDNKLIDLQQLELLEERQRSDCEEDIEVLERCHKDPMGLSEEPEMCKNVDQDMDLQQSEATRDNEELLVKAAENSEGIENSQEVQELAVKLEEMRCYQHEDCDQMASEKLQYDEPERIQVQTLHQAQERRSEDQLGQPQYLEQVLHMELAEESAQPENADLPEECTLPEPTVCVRAKHPGVAEEQEQTEPPEQKEQTSDSSQTAVSAQRTRPQEADESELTEQLSAEAEGVQQTAEVKFDQVDKQAEMSDQPEEVGGGKGRVTVIANGMQPEPPEMAVPRMNGCDVDSEMAGRLAERLFKLDGIQRVDVVKHLDKDNDFSHAVGEEYLKFFDFHGQTLDHALRSFLKVVVLIGETQERERVLQHFACRFHQCNPDSFSSSGSVLALTCALMLLNTDLHGQNVGKSMSSSKFVSNLDGMNDGENFSKELLKSLYNSIKTEPLEWAIDEGELMNSMFADEGAADEAPLRSKANPFQNVPHDKKASEINDGLLQRKLHADIDGKRTPWGKRGWKTFHGVLKGMVLYLQKVDYRRDHSVNEEVVSVHHSLAEPAADYTKKPNVFRLQTADWRVFLFQAPCRAEMYSWISRINLVSALHSSPPFPAAVGSQRRFFRPILPALQSAHSLERQLQSHSGMLESFKADLSYLQENLPEGKKIKAKELEEHRVRAEYLQHEMCRYKIYIQVLEAWDSVKKTDKGVLSIADLNLFDKAVYADSVEEEGEDKGLKKSHSSPALALDTPPPSGIKVKRNISERRTYRRAIIPRLHKET